MDILGMIINALVATLLVVMIINALVATLLVVMGLYV
jgi:hypothetical protein